MIRFAPAIAIAVVTASGCAVEPHRDTDTDAGPETGPVAAVDADPGADATSPDSPASPLDTGPVDADQGALDQGVLDQGALDTVGADAAIADAAPPPPALLTIKVAAKLVDGKAGAWSAAAARGYATQSRLPQLNGGFGSDTAECGLKGKIIKVTSLADSGPGSLRAAVEAKGKRTVVFEVSGAIRLKSDLWIGNPYITIAGQTAPPPGISLYHQQLKVRTNEVCVQHIRVRVGDRKADGSPYPADSGDQIDGVSVRNNGSGPMSNVILDNLSVSWSSDEAVPLGGKGLSNITVRDLLIAEPLNDNLHHKGTHGYCLLSGSYGANPKRVALIGNVMAHCVRRSPRIDEGTFVVLNNLTYNPGVLAIHLSGNDPSKDLYATIAGNMMRFPSAAADRWKGVPGNMGFVKALVQNVYTGSPRLVRIHLAGNSSALGLPIHLNAGAWNKSTTPSKLLPAAEVWHPSIYPVAAADAEALVLSNAGAFPRHRDAVDKRVIADIMSGTGTFVDSQKDVGGYPVVAKNKRSLNVPANPQGDDDADGVSNLIEWLQAFTDAVE